MIPWKKGQGTCPGLAGHGDENPLTNHSAQTDQDPPAYGSAPRPPASSANRYCETTGPTYTLGTSACIMHIACMATKTISLKIEAWERLRRARRYPSESFSEVVMRAEWPEVGITGKDLLDVYRDLGPHLSEEAVDRIDEADAADQPPEDKWLRL